MYRRKTYSREYNRKKRINKKFSPSAYKFNVPTYFQQKGRIIQTSPLRLYEPVTQIPNSKTLEKMYNTLVKAKYPGLNPSPIPPAPQPVAPLQPYVIQISSTLSSISGLDGQRMYPINIAELALNSGELTPLPNGWDYRFDLYNIIFRQHYNPNTSSDTHYHMDIMHPIFPSNNPFQFILKEVTTTAGNNGLNQSWILSMIPTTPNYAKVTRAVYTTGAITVTQSTLPTNDSIISDNGWYPILSTDYEPETNYIQYVLNSGSNPTLTIIYIILCVPIQN